MKKIPVIVCSVFMAAILCLTIVACNKKFDAPPAYVPPSLIPTLTIAQLEAKHTYGNTENITTDDIIQGTVIANDSSGNFYKQIVIEDSTGGIAVNIDDYNLYTSYPEGRVVFVKLKGLNLYDYHNLIQIGGDRDVTGAVNPIASPVKSNFVIKGAYGSPLAPKVLDITQLTASNRSLQNTLIQINGVEFADADKAKPYSDTSGAKNSINLIIQNCVGKTTTLRTSGYASFAALNVPDGKGSLTAVYSVYGTTSQLFIRDTADVKFDSLRCDGSGPSPTPPGPAVQTTIAAIRALYKSSDIKLGAYKIGGVVISDAASKNISSGSVVLQDGNSGISVYFGGTINYNLGDSVVVDITGDSLQNYKGALEIKTAYGTTPPAAVATGKTVTPQIFTIAQINTNIATIENTLVKISHALASGNTTYSGSNTLKDVSGSIQLYTSTSAVFATDNLPADTSDWVGLAKPFGSSNEFTIRNTGDVTTSTSTGGGGGGGGTTGSGIDLTTSPFTLNFDDIATALPAGVSVKLSSTATSLGTDGVFSGTQAAWSGTSAGYKNFASATGLTATSDATAQDASTNRALGVRQTSSTGYDPGAAFVFQVDNTAGKTNLSLSFLLQSLDNTIGRTTAWQVDYGFGDSPTIFTIIATSPATITTGPAFASTPVTVNFGSALNNQSGKVWIRIVALTATTGSGSRASTAVDDVKITWQ